MTSAQRFHLFIDTHDNVSLWTQACMAMGWDKEDRELRMAEFSKALGRQIKTSSEIDHLKDFDAVKGHLLALARPADMAAQLRITNMAKTRLIHRIKELAAEAYINKVIEDRFVWQRWLRVHHPECAGMRLHPKGQDWENVAPVPVRESFRDSGHDVPLLEELSEEDLTDLRNIVNRANWARKKKGKPSPKSRPARAVKPARDSSAETADLLNGAGHEIPF